MRITIEMSYHKQPVRYIYLQLKVQLKHRQWQLAIKGSVRPQEK